MDPCVARVDVESRHEGGLLRLTLSAAALDGLARDRQLHARMGEEGVFLMEGSTVELLSDGEPVELVRLEVVVSPAL